MLDGRGRWVKTTWTPPVSSSGCRGSNTAVRASMDDLPHGKVGGEDAELSVM